jgi:hypothetical protein
MSELFTDQVDFEIDPEKDYFQELVGEGKKYKDPVAAGRALVEKDAFIEKLKREAQAEREEAARIREELNSRQTLQSLIDQIKTMRTTERPDGGDHSPERPDPNQTTNSGPDIEKVVETILEQKTRQSVEKANAARVVEVLKQNFGPGYAEVLRKKVRELGLDEDLLDRLAKTNPSAFFKLVDVSETPKAPSNPPQSLRKSPDSTSGTRNFEYYEKLRRTDRDRYWSPEVQAQLIKDAAALGNDFYK